MPVSRQIISQFEFIILIVSNLSQYVVLTVGRRKQWPTVFSLSPESCLFNLSQLKSVLGRSFLYSMNQQSVVNVKNGRERFWSFDFNKLNSINYYNFSPRWLSFCCFIRAFARRTSLQDGRQVRRIRCRWIVHRQQDGRRSDHGLLLQPEQRRSMSFYFDCQLKDT